MIRRQNTAELIRTGPLLLAIMLIVLSLSGCGDNRSDLQTHETKVLSPYSGAGWDNLTAEERYRVNSAPDSDLISISYDNTSKIAHIIGSAGAVQSNAMVVIANLELGSVKVLKADKEGSFELNIEGRYGTNILIKQDASSGCLVVCPLGNPEQIVDGESIPVPGIIRALPYQNTMDGYPIAGGARIEDGGPAWVLEGNLSKVSFTMNDTVRIDGQVRILTNYQIPQGFSLNLVAQIIGDEAGIQVGPYGRFVSRLLTPTNLPIELNGDQNRFEIFEGCHLNDLVWKQEGSEHATDFSCTGQLKPAVPTGTYVMWLTLNSPGTHQQNVMKLKEKDLLKFGHEFGDNNIRLATITVGSPQTLRISTTLFADILQEGTRGGIISREDYNSLAISPRTITQHHPVIPRLDSYGKPWIHHMEPYALLLGITDRRPPSVPSIGFSFANSELQINIDRPDGQTDVIGPAQLVSYGVHTPTTPHGSQLSAGGNHIGEIPQFLGGKEKFTYVFPMDGDYVIQLTGSVSDTNGHEFEIGGTYDVTVGNSLDIETPLLPGTPFEVGNSLPVGISIFPGVAADITFSVTQILEDNSTIRKEYHGTANRNGWWDGDGQYFIFEKPGEYRLDVEARYKDENKSLWVGRMTYGSVVATPEKPFIAHGRRGHDLAEEITPPWGFGAMFPSEGHLVFPFFGGDILWGDAGNEVNRVDGTVGSGPGDAVNTVLSFQAMDMDHPLVARAMELVEGTNPQYSELKQAGQIPLITILEQYDCGRRRELSPGTPCNPGIDDNYQFKGVNAEDYTLLAYTYGSAQRPGVRVREIIQGQDTSAYWRFGDSYHLQSGNGFVEGDMPGDFKFLYGGAVIRDIQENTGIFAIYGSGWIHGELEDPLGSRFMPPFQGNAGGPDGGPLFKLHGRKVDMFFLPLAVRPGALLEVGDMFRMAGPIMPALPSKLHYSVTSPAGASRTFQGVANSVGYYYHPDSDFELDEPGIWTVELSVTHDGLTSAGPVKKPYPIGGPLTPDGRTFTFIVIDNDTLPLQLDTDLARLKPKEWYRGIENAHFETLLPAGWDEQSARIIVTIPGIVMLDEYISVNDGIIEWDLIGEKMNQLAPNFDFRTGLADTITVTIFAKDKSGRQASGTILTHGTRIPLPHKVPIALQSTSKSIKGANPTGQTSCIPGEQQLFSSDFEKGTSNWTFSDETAWSVVEADGSKVLRGTGHVHARVNRDWDEVIWRLRVKLISGNAHLNFHAKDNLRYLISLAEDGINVSWNDTHAGTNIHHSLNEWHVVEISMLEKVLRVAIDGILEIETPDPNPVPPGGIWLEVLPDSEVIFDDIVVCKPE